MREVGGLKVGLVGVTVPKQDGALPPGVSITEPLSAHEEPRSPSCVPKGPS